MTTGRLQGKRVVVLVAEGFEDLEFWVTVMRLREEGAVVDDRGHGAGEGAPREERPRSGGGRRRGHRLGR